MDSVGQPLVQASRSSVTNRRYSVMSTTLLTAIKSNEWCIRCQSKRDLAMVFNSTQSRILYIVELQQRRKVSALPCLQQQCESTVAKVCRALNSLCLIQSLVKVLNIRVQHLSVTI